MITFKLIRKFGKLLRGGAGRKEIFLGTLFGVLIGFIPGVNFSLLLTILLALLLNANFGFIMLGAALGKLLSLPMAALSFHIGFVIIHNIGLEEVFRSLCNTPFTALMDLNVYAMVGSFPIALAIGILLGSLFGTILLKIRQKMLEANQHEIIGKAFKNRISRFLLWLAFGKSKLSLDDEVPKQAPLLRKSGLILVASIIVIALLMEFLLLDIVVRKGIEASIARATGAEVNIAKAHFSVARGQVEIEDLQVTDPDKPTHNLVQIHQLMADLNISELLSRNYTIDLLSGNTLRQDVLRTTPGIVYQKAKEPEEKKTSQETGKALKDYFAQAETWEKHGRRAYDYLTKRKKAAQRTTRNEEPKADKETALDDAKARGYLKAAADLVADRPAWLIHQIKIEHVDLGSNLPDQTLLATEVCSHPELNGKPTGLSLTPTNDTAPSLKVVLRFDNPSAQHALQINLKDLNLEDSAEMSPSFPIDITNGKANLSADGNFSTDTLNIPFTIFIHGLNANVEEGQSVMGMDSTTATEVFSSIAELEIDGQLQGSLLLPRIAIDYEKLTKSMQAALVAAGKKELAKRANAEVDKAKEALKQKAGKEVNALLEQEGGSIENQAKDALKKLF
jgi:uncharacterized protein (TIGR03546 family)